MKYIFIVEIIGTIAFAISGANVAIEKKMDLFGVVFLSITTSVGGGMIRDILMGITPPVAFQKPYYALIAMAVAIIVFIPKIRKYVQNKDNFILLIMDTIGLGLFTVMGTRTGMESGNVFLAVFVGMITGVGGGILRDLFAGEKPYIFVRHFYACASVIGAIVTVALWQWNVVAAMTIGAAVVIILRLLAARFKWNLPRA